ncbi:hypothetical protein, partial [Gluconacetobacter diazotrophicus]
MAYVDEVQNRINEANLPFNFVIWLAENDKTKSEFKFFRGGKTKKDIEPDPKVFEQYQPVVIHPSLRRDGVNGDMDWY